MAPRSNGYDAPATVATLRKLARQQFPMGLWAVVMAKVALLIRKLTWIALIASTLFGVGSLTLLLISSTLRNVIINHISDAQLLKATNSEFGVLPPFDDVSYPVSKPESSTRRK